MSDHGRVFSLVSALLAAAFLLTACPPVRPDYTTQQDSHAERVRAEILQGPVTLDWNLGTEPPTLDPALAGDSASIQVLNEVMLSLTELDPETREPEPELAASWVSSENGAVWTFTLREDVPWVTYQEGEVVQVLDDAGLPRIVNAHDVVYGVQRSCDSKTVSDSAYILYVIVGCQEAHTGEGSFEEVGVVALDDFTVEFTLTYGATFFPQIVSMTVARPMPRWLIEAEQDGWTEAGIMQNNGPYVLALWQHSDRIQLVRNPSWYGWAEMADVAGNIEVINIALDYDDSSAFSLYRRNAFDWANVPLESLDSVTAAGSELVAEYRNFASNCSYYFGFVTQREAVSDVRVRRALSMAVDRKTLVEETLKGGQIPANTFTNPLNFGAPQPGDPDIAPWAVAEEDGGLGYAAAVEMGQELMADAGFPRGEGLSLLLFEEHNAAVLAVTEMWSAAFPQITFEFEYMDWGAFLYSLRPQAPLENKPDLYFFGWCADYPHANNWVHEVFNPTQGSNATLLSFDDPQVGELVRQLNDATIAAQTAPPAEQLALYKQAEMLLINDIVGIIPLLYFAQEVVVKPWLDRIYSHELYMYRWSIDKAAKAEAER